MAETLRPLLDRLMAVRADFADLRPAVEAGAPWPLAQHFGAEPEASWGPAEVLAHMAEMLPFWYAQMEMILAGPAWPVTFGRLQTDANRIAAIERDRLLPAGKLFDRIDAGIEPYQWRLPRLTDTEVARTGLHPTRGEMTISQFLETLVIDHGEGHVTQLRETVAAS